jgi:hypothetical protein
MFSERAYVEAANALGCEVAAIKAVVSVESGGNGFLPDGRPVILFEAHHFGRLSNHKFTASHPSLSARTWADAKRHYARGGDWVSRGIQEQERLRLASLLDRNAALQSASYGPFQIMGFNWQACGFPTLQGFINAVWSGPDGNMKAFVGFIRYNTRLLRAIQTKDWALFARIYNGPGYAANKYDTKMESAYRRFSNNDAR